MSLYTPIITDVSDQSRQKIRDAVIAGDMETLLAIDKMVPGTIEAVQKQDKDLVDLAYDNRHADTVFFLIIGKHFKVSEAFDSNPAFERPDEMDNPRRARFRKTLEVLADTMLDFHYSNNQRSAACMQIHKALIEISKHHDAELCVMFDEKDIRLNSAIIPYIASNQLSRFAKSLKEEEKTIGALGDIHYINMLHDFQSHPIYLKNFMALPRTPDAPIQRTDRSDKPRA